MVAAEHCPAGGLTSRRGACSPHDRVAGAEAKLGFGAPPRSPELHPEILADRVHSLNLSLARPRTVAHQLGGHADKAR